MRGVFKMEQMHEQFRTIVRHLLKNPACIAIFEKGDNDAPHAFAGQNDELNRAAAQAIANILLAFPGRAEINRLTGEDLSDDLIEVWRGYPDAYTRPRSNLPLELQARPSSSPRTVDAFHIGIPL